MKLFMKSPNAYADSKDTEKVVQIKMMDVIYYSKVCTLIYLIDVTKLLHD